MDNETQDTVILHTEVELPESVTGEQKRMYNQFATLFTEMFRTFVRKNISYGNSFLASGMEAYIKHPEEYRSPVHANLKENYVRIKDKNTRFENIALYGGNELVGEDTAETTQDAAVYWVMQTWLAKHGDTMLPALFGGVESDAESRQTEKAADGLASPEELLDVMESENRLTVADTEETIDAVFGAGTYEEIK